MTSPAGPPFLPRWVVIALLAANVVSLVASLALTHWMDAGANLGIIVLAADWLMTEPTRRTR